MSIAARVAPFSRSFRSLRMEDTRRVKGEIETRRSLLPGGIVPRSVVCDRLIANGSGSGDPELQKGEAPARRTLARDRPSPYGSAGVFFPVARGPVPRDVPGL